MTKQLKLLRSWAAQRLVVASHDILWVLCSHCSNQCCDQRSGFVVNSIASMAYDDGQVIQHTLQWQNIPVGARPYKDVIRYYCRRVTDT